MNHPVLLLAAAMTAYDRVHALTTCDLCGATWDSSSQEGTECQWCAQRRQTDHDHILKPPAARGYGYATAGDLVGLGIDPAQDRADDLEHWRHDLQLAADTGLITEHEGQVAWQSATTKHHPSTSSTGTTSTTASTATTTPSSKASPTPAAGPASPPRRKRANQRSSSPYQLRHP